MSSVMVIRRYKCRPITVEGKTKKQAFHEEGFLQVCGVGSTREMYVISDSLAPLQKSPYKLCCNCQQCISYSYEDISQDMFTEPLMRAVNMVFNILCSSGHVLQSTAAVQNCDGSSTMTWVWTKEPN